MSGDGSARRPVYLVIALITLWLVGLHTMSEGLSVIQIVRDPLVVGSGIGGKHLQEVMQAAFASAVASHSNMVLPVGIAQLLLGASLVLVSMRALFRRPISTSIALQIVLANAVLVIVGYVLREPVRTAIVDAVVASGLEQQPGGSSRSEAAAFVREKVWWSFRIGLGLELGALVLSGVALASRAARGLSSVADPVARDEG
jgi:predicted cation transporter